MLCCYSRIFTINAYKGDRNVTQKLIYLFRHFYPKIRSLTCCAFLHLKVNLLFVHSSILFLSLYCLSFDLRILITPLVSSDLSCVELNM
jgi:hypothetical protein